jgi:general secretion pathway protein K
MVGRHSLLIAQYRQGFSGDQALEYALGAEAFARQILYQDWSETGPEKDTLLELWAQAAPPFEIENGVLEIQARDLHRCFNLNSVGAAGSGGTPQSGSQAITPVADPSETDPGSSGTGQPGISANHQRLRQLLRNLDLPEALADGWRDWIDPDQELTGFGAEDGDYLLFDPAYRPPNALASHVSELRLLKGVEPEVYEALAPSVCVLPNSQLRLNVNTAGPEVLAALSPEASAEALTSFTEGTRDLTDVSQFTQEFPDLAGAVDALTVWSEYFEVSIRAQVDDAQVELVTVLRRDPANGRSEVVSRDLSRNFRSLFLAELDTRDNSP